MAMWRERALRLEAEMDSFRKRQQQMAEITIAEERERLLRHLLQVADDLDRALAAGDATPAKLIEGLSLTRQTMARLLTSEGVEPVPADGTPFDPNWHEAVGTQPSQQTGKAPGEIVEVVAPGYRLGERLLRPARVIVAV
jgi:molecular chaperone GrpE